MRKSPVLPTVSREEGPRQTECWGTAIPHVPSVGKELSVSSQPQGRESRLAPLFLSWGMNHVQEQASSVPSQPAAELPGRKMSLHDSGAPASRCLGLPQPSAVMELGFCTHLPKSVLPICSEPEVTRESVYQATSTSPALGTLPKVTPLVKR